MCAHIGARSEPRGAFACLGKEGKINKPDWPRGKEKMGMLRFQKGKSTSLSLKNPHMCVQSRLVNTVCVCFVTMEHKF